MPPGTYRGAIAAARNGGMLPTVCRCRHEECTCDQARAPPLAAQAEAARTKEQTRRLLVDTPDEAAIRIAQLLGDPRQMLRLAIACKRFRVKSFAWWREVSRQQPRLVAGGQPSTALVGAAHPITLVDEAARRWVQLLNELRLPTVCPTTADVMSRPTNPHASRVSPTWLAKMHEAQRQHSLAVNAPTAFTRHHLFIELSEDGRVATRKRTLQAAGPVDASHRTAATNIVMRSGRHFVEFTVLEGVCMFLGVISSAWNVESGNFAERVTGGLLWHRQSPSPSGCVAHAAPRCFG